MIVKKILDKNNIHYQLKQIKNVRIYELDDEVLLVTISNNKNVFSINRRLFYEIDNKLLPYSFCLEDTSTNNLYYIKIEEPNNFLRKSFESTNKDTIYFGKKILQHRIKENELIVEIKRIGDY